MATGAIIARIISQYSDKGSKAAQKDIAKLGKNFDQFARKATIAFAAASVAVGAFALKVGKDAVQAAISDQKSQALLANSLRNTVKASDATIASTEDFITVLQKQVSVADDELRPAYGKLVAATGSIAGGQQLLSTALNVSAQSGADLASSSDAIIKASRGQYKALALLVPGLTVATMKTKDFNKVLKETDKETMGAAAKRAGTLEYKLKGLQIAYSEILETLGYALLPVIQNFADVITTKVLPVLEAWISANKDKLAKTLETLLSTIPLIITQLFNFFDAVQNNIGTLKILAALITGLFVGTKVLAGITFMVTAIKGLAIAYEALTGSATAAGIAAAFASGGATAIAAGAAIVAFGATAALVYSKLNNSSSQLKQTTKDTSTYWGNVYDSAKDVVKPAGDLYKFTAATLVKTKAQLKAEADKILLEKAYAKLKGLGVKPTTETDLITLEAARLNLLKQNNIQEQLRLEQILAGIKAQFTANEAIARYADLLGVVADSKISNEEVAVLAAKWGLSKDAVVAYVGAVLAIGDNVLSDAAIVNYAKQWNITTTQAGIYLDVFKAINDGSLSDEEVITLAKKWSLTNDEVKKYADQIAKGVTPSELWAVDGINAANSWIAALAALNAYLAALGKKTATVADVSYPLSNGTVLPAGYNFSGGYARSAEEVQAIQDVVTANVNSKLERMASGGIVTSATAAIIGEAGPEAVIPLSQMGGMGTTINITVNGSVTSASDLTETIRNGILRGQVSGRGITTRVLDL